jgi:hypothetical protein
MRHPKFVLKMLLTSAIALSILSCDKEDDVKLPSKPDGEALQNNFEANIEKRIQSFTLKASDGGTITGSQGTKIMFYPNAFVTQDNQMATGNVSIELVEIFKRADMLFTGMATNGRNANGERATLVSGGEFFVNATQDGKQLKVDGGFHIMAPADNTGGPDNEMMLFTGEEECANPDKTDCEIVWVEQDRRVEVGKNDNQGTATGGGSVYMTFQSEFGWTNIDKWYSDPRPKTTIFVDVPEGYNNENCAVYLSYDGEPSALASFDMYNATTGLFTEHYGLIPIGLNVHFILVSVVDGQWHYAIQPATITANHVEVIGSVQSITEDQLKALINDLP